jgi:DNA-binding NtrC family response regulator
MGAVLIVDDEKHIRTHLVTYVRSLGHSAQDVRSAKEAMLALSLHAFDVVITDVRMAGMDGLALLKEIKRRAPETVVVLMTAYPTVPESVAAMRAGAYDYLVKPFGLDQIRLLLKRALAAPRHAVQSESLEESERHQIEQAIAKSFTLEEAAARLGINITTLWRKRKRYHLE